MREWFAPITGPVFKGFDNWYGADVVVATGWQTAHPVMLLPGCAARAYLIHDHEPEFYATSVESRFAEATYGLGMHAICASPWLEEIVRDRYGGTTSRFDFGVDHDVYFPRPIARRPDTIALYARDITPRRASAARRSWHCRSSSERRRDLRVVVFGSARRDRRARRLRAPRRPQPRRARVGLQRGDSRPRAFADELLPDPAGDARVRTAVRRPRGR